jgi:AcrR family transcriptional regulator
MLPGDSNKYECYSCLQLTDGTGIVAMSVSVENDRRQPRQQRSLKKVEKILDAVEVVVARDGLDGVTTTSIANETGFAVGTIYQYFSNRTELLLNTHERLFERFTETIQGAAEDTEFGNGGHDGIDALISLYIETARNHPGYLPLLDFARMNQPVETDDRSTNDKLGALIDRILLTYAPSMDSDRIYVARNVILRLLTVLVDMVLLEPDPALSERFESELIAHSRYALRRAIEGGVP